MIGILCLLCVFPAEMVFARVFEVQLMLCSSCVAAAVPEIGVDFVTGN